MTKPSHDHTKKRLPPPPPRPWKKAFFSYGDEDTNEERQQKSNEVAKGLEKIYFVDGKKDLAVLEHSKSHRVLRFFLWLLLLCTLASGAAWAGMIWLQPNAEVETLGLEMMVEGSTAVILGQEQTFIVKYRNKTFQPMSDAQIRISWPADFQLVQAVPTATDESNNAWNIGMLAPGASGEISIKGIFLGSLGAKSAFQAIATYQTSGQSRAQESLATIDLEYGDSVFDGRLIVPTKAIAGDKVPLIFELINKGEKEASGLIVRVQLPEGFVLSATTGTPMLASSNGKDWELLLPSLPANTTSTMQWDGAFVSGVSGDADVLVRVGKLRDTNFVTLFQTKQTIPVLAGDLSLHVVTNGSDGDRTILPGESIRMALSYKNISPETLGDVAITVRFESIIDGVNTEEQTLLNWAELENESRGVTSTQGRIQTLRFDKNTNLDFAALSPGKEGIIEISVPTAKASEGMKEAKIVLDVMGSLSSVGEEKIARSMKANPIQIRYRTDADLEALARYYTEEGAPVGSGPLPPVVGKTTSYRVEWSIKKQLHALENIEVTATLPENVSWSGQALPDAGDIVYDERLNTVIWKLNRMPEDIKELVARFDVSLIPSELDSGRFARLVGGAKFTAIDTLTSETILIEKPSISTDLQNDEGAQGKGVVVGKED